MVNLPLSSMQRAANVRRASHWKDIKQLSHGFSFVGVSIIRRKMGSVLMDKDLHPSCEEIIFLKIISYIKKRLQSATVENNTTTLVGLKNRARLTMVIVLAGGSLFPCLLCFNKSSREIRWFDV